MQGKCFSLEQCLCKVVLVLLSLESSVLSEYNLAKVIQLFSVNVFL